MSNAPTDAGQPPASQTDAPKVLLRGVCKEFETGEGSRRKRFRAVENINLEVREGEFVTLAGPTGCGKSTVLNLIAGFEFPDAGEVLFEGQPVRAAGADRLVIFQEPGLFPWLTVRQNVEFGLRVLGLGKQERKERALHYLRMVHLEKFRHSYPFQLSGGMRQRTALARALAVEPRMLLMDEPFAALDPRTRDILHAELQNLWLETHKTIVFVTHSVEEAIRLSDRVLVMATQPGRIRKEFQVRMPHPRDFLDPALAALRAAILKELKDELDKLLQREGDDDWHLKKDALGAGPGNPLGSDLGVGV